jgi:transcription factor C subunit 7
VHDRTEGFLNVSIPTIERRWPEHKRILFVTHAAIVITLARAFAGDRTLHLRAGCCSLTEAVRKKDGTNEVVGGWELLKLADGAHLEEGASRDWGFEDIQIAHGKVRNNYNSAD